MVRYTETSDALCGGTLSCWCNGNALDKWTMQMTNGNAFRRDNTSRIVLGPRTMLSSRCKKWSLKKVQLKKKKKKRIVIITIKKNILGHPDFFSWGWGLKRNPISPSYILLMKIRNNIEWTQICTLGIACTLNCMIIVYIAS